MTLGPPPSAAGSSHHAPDNHNSGSTVVSSSSEDQTYSGTPQDAPQQRALTVASSGNHGSHYQSYGQSSARFSTAQSTPPSQSYPSYPSTNNISQQLRTNQGPNQVTSYGYYNYSPTAWGNAWPAAAYPYGGTGTYQYSYPQTSPLIPSQTPSYPSAVPQTQSKPKTPSPSPSPPPPFHKQWDAVMKTFLSSVGLTQALRGFEADMVIMNTEWERKTVPTALGELMRELLRLGESKRAEEENAIAKQEQPEERSLEERKLDYVHFANGAVPRSQTSITKSISLFLAQNRARNDESNRTEFLQSLTEKRRRLSELGEESSGVISSCSRTDAKTQNRDVQMKYDIAKNEDGPLRKTLRVGSAPDASTAQGRSCRDATAPRGHAEQSFDDVGAELYPALDERLGNVEAHLAVRYVPSPPRSLFDRLKFLEDHIIQLEKEYPPWAALHFNQPNRGWPPPPRPTPIIVPSHLTSTATNASQPHSPHSTEHDAGAVGSTTSDSNAPKGRGKQGRTNKSSLHRAVMEKLEVQKAMNDLAGQRM
ncbi:hypothetical protein BKA93DRAFT_820415 [Sparassis latifolia]